MGMRYDIRKWFDLNLGRLFVSPKDRKYRWREYLEKKYSDDNTDKSKVTLF